MKRKLLTAGALLVLSCAARAQTADRQVLGTAGASFSATAFSADHTTGEVATHTGSSGSFILTQGFQQPPANGTAIKEPGVAVNWKLYPNPATQSITLELGSTAAADLFLSVSGINGQSLYRSEKLHLNGSLKKELDISGYAAGNYFVNITDLQGKQVSALKFQKQ